MSFDFSRVVRMPQMVLTDFGRYEEGKRRLWPKYNSSLVYDGAEGLVDAVSRTPISREGGGSGGVYVDERGAVRVVGKKGDMVLVDGGGGKRQSQQEGGWNEPVYGGGLGEKDGGAEMMRKDQRVAVQKEAREFLEGGAGCKRVDDGNGAMVESGGAQLLR